jgi:hypothetical protein
MSIVLQIRVIEYRRLGFALQYVLEGAEGCMAECSNVNLCLHFRSHKAVQRAEPCP